MPPQAMVLLAIVAIQLGAALSVTLIPLLTTEGTVAVRIIFSAVLLWIAARGRVRSFARTFVDNSWLLISFGLCLAVLYYCFMQAIARIPLGAAVALEFIGPLSVAVLNSRKLSHLGWIALAGVGIALLSPLTGVELDPVGIIFALLAGAGWATFIILAAKVGNKVPGNDGLAIGMAIAALTMIPFFVPITEILISDLKLLLLGVAVALLSTTIPFTLEFQALKKLPARSYGILVSLEPAVAASIGAIFLGERIGLQGVLAVACVVIAAIGITIADGRDKAVQE
ncbi:MAG: EamA family transporter [Pseudomonadota bacterium]